MLKVNVEQALRVIRQARRTVSPPIPIDMRIMGETIASPRWQGRLLYVKDDINNIPFYQGHLAYIENGQSVFGGLMFSNNIFLQHYAPYLQNIRVLAEDGTFIVVLHFLRDIDQLVTIHAVLHNIVRPPLHKITFKICNTIIEFSINIYII